MKKENQPEKEDQPKKVSSLLDRYIQRNTMDKMQKLDDQALAQAIKSLLLKGNDESKNLN
ncbi:hypothetical protein [Cellulosilyticum sp. I15G10I2]|uniref:hypothetical protein n=1 Tax=Cellulosilyticum sp. I15G10I2 TaxID=1892843 RepID=UPI00085C7BC8|nr:hypothetical protein [Cellulosilyticum sp. I15G10I2]